MPNYCNNILVLKNTDPAQITKAAEALKAGDFLKTFIPIPEELKETTAPAKEGSPSVIYNGQEYTDWYMFCVNEWGTKWDVDAYNDAEISEDGTELTVSFDSAWSPPTEAYRKLEEQGFEIDAMYYEPGMGFCGEYSDGFDETYEVSANADDVDAEIPERINEAFCIAENMRMWEEDMENEPTIDAYDPPAEE